MDTPSRMHKLPVELLHAISHYLPDSSLIALKLSSKQLMSMVVSPRPDWRRSANYCEKRAACRYLSEAQDAGCDKRTCVLCGTYAYEDGLIDGKPICKAHEGRFMALTTPSCLEPGLKTRLRNLAKELSSAVWISFERTLCVHQKLVMNWDDGPRSCGCDCESCGHWTIRCYVRVASPSSDPGHDTTLTYFKLSEDGKHVIEEHRTPSPDTSSYACLAGLEWAMEVKCSVAVPVRDLVE